MRNTKLLILMGISLCYFCFGRTAAAQVMETKPAAHYQTEGYEQSGYHFKSQAWFDVSSLLLNYEEKFSNSDMRKSWSTPGLRLDVGVNAYHDAGEDNMIGIKLQGGYLRTGTDRETVNSSDGASSEKDDLQIKGVDLFLGISWVRVYNDKFSLEQTLGVGERQFNFMREGLILNSESLGRVTWVTTSQYVSYSPALTYQATPNLGVSFKPSVAYIFYAQSNNDMTDVIRADDGYIVGAALRADYRIGANTSIFLEGGWEQQKINERVTEPDKDFPPTFSEWPDNKLTIQSLTAGLTINF